MKTCSDRFRYLHCLQRFASLIWKPVAIDFATMVVCNRSLPLTWNDVAIHFTTCNTCGNSLSLFLNINNSDSPRPGIEPGSLPYQDTVLPLDHWYLVMAISACLRHIKLKTHCLLCYQYTKQKRIRHRGEASAVVPDQSTNSAQSYRVPLNVDFDTCFSASDSIR